MFRGTMYLAGSRIEESRSFRVPPPNPHPLLKTKGLQHDCAQVTASISTYS